MDLVVAISDSNDSMLCRLGRQDLHFTPENMMHGRNGADVHMPAVGNPILQSQVPLLTNDQMVDDIPSEHQALVSSFMGGGGKRIHPLPFSADPNVPGKSMINTSAFQI